MSVVASSEPVERDQPRPPRLKIVYLAAGAGGMICGSCLHDNTLAAALLRAGQDVLLVPTYTPLKVDEPSVAGPRLFFGGINVYLQQHSALFRHTPWFVDRLLDNPNLVARLAERAGGTQAEALGPLTVSMLEGRHGRQRKEVAKILDWLRREERPDVVHLSNSMLSGLVEPLSEALRVPVFVTLSGEDIFLEKLPSPFYQQSRDLLRRHAQRVAGFVALNGYYADFMSDYLAVPRERISVIPHGLDLTGYPPRRVPASGEPARIGYLARICPEKGLHQLVSALRRLAEMGDLPPWTVEAAGYLGPADQGYLNELQSRLAGWGMSGRFCYRGELTREEKLDFLASLQVFSVPTVYRESKGLSVLEALASGVPVVLPAQGAFPEMVNDTGGGLLTRPNDPDDLARGLAELLRNPERAATLGRTGQTAIGERYTAERMAQTTLELYHRARSR